MATNGIDFVIGGKDQAKPAMSAVEKSLERLEAKTESLGRATKMLGNITAGLAVAYGTIQSALTILGGLDKINTAYDEQAEAVKGLEVALKLQGAAVETESARLQDFSNQVQDLTGINDDMTMGLMRQAAMLGTESDKLDDMAKAAIGLGEAMGTDAAYAMSILRAATEGHFDAMNKVIPSIRGMATDQEKLNAVLELAGRGFESASTWSSAVAESGGKASIAIDSLMESVGAIIAPFRVLINAGIQKFSESLQTVLIPAVEYANEMLANIGPIIDWVKEKVVQGLNIIIGAFTFLEVIVTNLGSVWELMKAVAERAMIQIVDNVKYSFTDVIPAYLMWFGENIINLMKDAWNGAIAVVTNAGKILGDLVYTIFEFIASGGEGGIDGLMSNLGAAASRSLLDGFKSSLTDLPEIAGRQITDREKELTEKIGQVGANLGDEFSRKMKERMLGIGDGANSALSKDIDLKIKKTVDNATGAASGGKSGSQAGTLTASESRLLSRGQVDPMRDWMREAAINLAMILSGTNATAKATDELNKKTPQFAPEDEVKLVMVQ